MRLALELASRNVGACTGGPFGAAVFERDSGALVSVGVNVVMAERCSAAHAEIMALALAQARRGTHTLAADGGIAYQLVSTAEPCAMCMGACAWSGIAELVCGARDADVRQLGFDEGPKPRAWRRALAARGIAVVPDVRRQEACAVLARYAASGGHIYNARP
jgi:tRNA(Arg) A34 adenosine deaminase TadA